MTQRADEVIINGRCNDLLRVHPGMNHLSKQQHEGQKANAEMTR
jgi:hypothetical protein